MAEPGFAKGDVVRLTLASVANWQGERNDMLVLRARKQRRGVVQRVIKTYSAWRPYQYLVDFDRVHREHAISATIAEEWLEAMP